MTRSQPADTTEQAIARTDFRVLRAAAEPWNRRLGRGLWRSLRQAGYGVSLYRLRLGGRHPMKLLASPDDPWPGSPDRGAAILDGAITLAEEPCVTDPRLWQELAAQPAEVQAYFQGFEWLRDLARLADQSRAQSCAGALTASWLDRHGRCGGPAWRAEILARRVIQWMIHAPLILSTTDMVYRSAVLNSLVRQARHLSRVVQDAPDGTRRIEACCALIMSGLLIPNGETRVRRGEGALKTALERLTLADGGFLTRSAGDVLVTMQHLILLRASYDEREAGIPEWLAHTLDRQGPFLRAMRHGDGLFAAHNGAGSEEPDLIDRVLEASGARGRAINNAATSGYFRLRSKSTTLIMDAGPPPPEGYSGSAHAGTLGFEFSDGRERLIINMGRPAGNDEIDRLTRTTAAHSTLVLDDRNSTEIKGNGELGRGVSETRVSRLEMDDGDGLLARHNGYAASSGLTHQRSVHLNRDGTLLQGEDRLTPAADGKARRRAFSFDIRFHLASDVAASPTQDGHSIILRLANRHGWQFRADGRSVALEESLYIPADGRPRRSMQMVISGDCDSGGVVVPWQLRRLDTRN